MELLRQLIKSFWFILILTVGIGQELTGCMDDGYQQWSPNPGSPACNYNQFAIIEGDCLYNNCLGVCQEILNNNDNWIPNPDFTYVQYDGCGECILVVDYDELSCDQDCAGVPNGTAYINPSCIDNINVNGCVGGDTGNSDCLNIDLSFEELLVSDSTETIKVFVTNLDTLISLDIEFQYDSSILDTMLFSLDGTALFDIGYNVEDITFIGSDNLSQVDFTLYFEPHTSELELFSLSGREHIFNIVLKASREIQADTTTQIIINELSVNEILMDDSNWVGGEISVMMHSGCADEDACNYDSYAGNDDGSCLYNDACGVCDGIETIAHNCNCTDANDYDCYDYCILDDCPDELPFTPGCAFIDPNCNVCVGGATERYPCEQDCTGEWGGEAYLDACENCIAIANDIDCFYSSINIYNSIGNVVVDTTIAEFENFHVALHMQNLPDSLAGIIVNLGFDTSIVSLNDWSINPNDLVIGGDLTGELGSSYILDGDIIDTTFRASIQLNTNEFYQGDSGTILFLQFSSSGTNGESTLINYNEIQINEHVMKEQNYTPKMIYFGDCNGVFNGQTLFDDCDVCDGPGAIYECLDGGYVGTGGCYDIAGDACDCAGNTPEDLYEECVGVDCDCEGNLSINESIIPKSYTLSQNYPNPFNPITYIHYSVPNYDFINIDIINISGQTIKTIVQTSHQPGNYETIWDGTNYYEISVPSGIYFYKMDADEFVFVKKLVLLK